MPHRFVSTLSVVLLACLCVVPDLPAAGQVVVSETPTSPVPVIPWGTPSQHDVTVGPGFIHVPGPGFNGRRLKMLHLALIPQPSANQGLVVGWGTTKVQDNNGWYQRWTVIDPSTDPITVKWNDELLFPGSASGDLFCSGHAWTADGRLLVAGGTTFYPPPPPPPPPPPTPFGGGKMALLYDPAPLLGLPYGRWIQIPDMEQNRWYPTVTLLGNGLMMVSGGTHNGPGNDNYELFDPTTLMWVRDTAGNRTFPGPGNPSMGNYPRIHVLSDGSVFWSSPQRKAARLDTSTAVGTWTWSPFDKLSSVHRHDGASFLYPQTFGLEDIAVILGGSQGSGHASAHKTVEAILPKQNPMTTSWVFGPSMRRNRVHLNTVILPDFTLLSVGGNDTDATGAPIFWFDAERFDGASWTLTPNGASRRDYHSTAALLPDGRVLTAGGDNRDWDYQLFYPPYLLSGLPRPGNVSVSSSTLTYWQNTQATFTATATGLPDNVTITRAVLLAPASTTHHSDMHQRLVDLPVFSSSPSSITFGGPYNNCQASNPWHFVRTARLVHAVPGLEPRHAVECQVRPGAMTTLDVGAS